MPRTARHLPIAILLFCAFGLLAACQTGGGRDKDAAAVTPNAVAGDPIEVTALDAPSAASAEALPSASASAASAATTPGQPETAAPQPTPVAASAAVGADPVAEAQDATAASEPAPQPDLAEEPVTPKSEQQLACEKKKGRWGKIGRGDARACVFQTRDSGKRCERESQCDSVCLARSGTCAPFKPMFGCNEIIQDNGMRVTLCIE